MYWNDLQCVEENATKYQSRIVRASPILFRTHR